MKYKLAVRIVIDVKWLVIDHEDEVEVGVATLPQQNPLIRPRIIVDLARLVYLILRALVVNEDHMEREEQKEGINQQSAEAAEECLVLLFPVLVYG